MRNVNNTMIRILDTGKVKVCNTEDEMNGMHDEGLAPVASVTLGSVCMAGLLVQESLSACVPRCQTQNRHERARAERGV